MELRYSRKSMLGSRRSHIGTLNEATLKQFEMLPRNLQIAETLRKQDSISNSKMSSALSNITVRQPRRSMLGTRKLNRDSIVPPLAPDSSLSSQNQDSLAVESDSSAVNTLSFSQLRMSIVHDDVPRIPSSEDNYLQRTLPSDLFGKLSKTTTLTEESESPPLHHNVPIREMFPSSTSNSKDNSFIENETLLANDESLLATTLIDTTVTNEDDFLASTEKLESPLPRSDTSIREISPPCIPAVTNKSSSLSTSLKDITNTHTDRIEVSIPENNATLIEDTTTVHLQSKEHDDEMLFKMLDLINTWISRSTESVEIYGKEIAELQKKKDQANAEIEDMKNLKKTLIKKFSVRNEEKENIDVEPIPTTVEDEVFKSPVVSPSKTYLKEMRSTIKFMKTPLGARNRMPRPSMMLTPHSMSFCLQNQFEQLLE